MNLVILYTLMPPIGTHYRRHPQIDTAPKTLHNDNSPQHGHYIMQLKDFIFDLLDRSNVNYDKDQWAQEIDNWSKVKSQSTMPISVLDQIRNCDGKTMSYQWSDKCN